MIKRRTFLKSAGGAALAWLCPAGRSRAALRSRPNILLIMSDQHSARVLGCNDHPDVHTPTLDALAAEGVNFTRAYCQQGLCVPSRISMFSSRYVHSHGVKTNDMAASLSVPSLVALLRDSGYQTAAIGKRHLPFSWDHGFQFARSVIGMECKRDQKAGRPNYFTWLEEGGLFDKYQADFAAEHTPEASQSQGLAAHESALDAAYTAEAYVADQTIEYLREHRDPGKPFFLWTSFIRPHQPYTPPRPYSRMYDPAAIVMPGNWQAPVEGLPARLREVRLRTRGTWNFGAVTPEYLRQVVAWYYGLVTEIDTHIGRILTTLREFGLEKDTIIVYAADHGDFAGEFGLMEKHASVQNLYEATLRVPLIWHGPTLAPAHRTISQPVELIDVMPTLFDLAGMPLPEGCEGASLAPLMNGGNHTRKDAFSESAFSQTLITPHHKYSRNVETKEVHLFDLDQDPWEVRNLYGQTGPLEQELVPLIPSTNLGD